MTRRELLDAMFAAASGVKVHDVEALSREEVTAIGNAVAHVNVHAANYLYAVSASTEAAAQWQELRDRR